MRAVDAELTPESDHGAEQDFIAAVEAGIDENPATEDISSGFTDPVPVDSNASELTVEQSHQKIADTTEQQEPASQTSSPTSDSPHSGSDPGDVADDQSPEAFRLHVSFSVDTSPYSSPQQNEQSAGIVADSLPPTEDAEPEELAASEPEQELLIDWTEVIEGIELLQVTQSPEPGERGESVEPPASDTSAQETANADLEDSEVEQHEDDIDQSVEAIRARALQAELQDEEALEAIPSENLQALGKFSTPVEILAGQPRSLRRQLTWAGLSLVAGLMLAAQYLWQEMDRYSQNITLRPVYETACQWLDCELPVYVDIDAIRASNLAVRSHPEVGNALTVNIEFQNFSPFAQQFPILVLSFNAANNSIIALREFAATEYLPEQLRGRQLLPPQTPLQIDLSIIDPGDDAVNYTLAFRNP